MLSQPSRPVRVRPSLLATAFLSALHLSSITLAQKPIHTLDISSYHLTLKNEPTVIQERGRFRLITRTENRVLLDIDPKMFSVSKPSAYEPATPPPHKAEWQLKQMQGRTLFVKEPEGGTPGAVFLQIDGNTRRSIFSVEPSCQIPVDLNTFFINADRIVVPDCKRSGYQVISPEGKSLYEIPVSAGGDFLRGDSVFVVTSGVFLFKDLFTAEPSSRRAQVFCLSNGKQIFDKKWARDEPPNDPVVALSPSEDVIALFDYKTVSFYRLDVAACKSP